MTFSDICCKLNAVIIKLLYVVLYSRWMLVCGDVSFLNLSVFDLALPNINFNLMILMFTFLKLVPYYYVKPSITLSQKYIEYIKSKIWIIFVRL